MYYYDNLVILLGTVLYIIILHFEYIKSKFTTHFTIGK